MGGITSDLVRSMGVTQSVRVGRIPYNINRTATYPLSMALIATVV